MYFALPPRIGTSRAPVGLFRPGRRERRARHRDECNLKLQLVLVVSEVQLMFHATRLQVFDSAPIQSFGCGLSLSSSSISPAPLPTLFSPLLPVSSISLPFLPLFPFPLFCRSPPSHCPFLDRLRRCGCSR